MSTNNRIRGRRLQVLRKRLFQEQPLCVECKKHGRVRLSQERDHIIAIEDGGEDTEENTQGLCKDCHAKKSGYKPAIGIDGWPL